MLHICIHNDHNDATLNNLFATSVIETLKRCLFDFFSQCICHWFLAAAVHSSKCGLLYKVQVQDPLMIHVLKVSGKPMI